MHIALQLNKVSRVLDTKKGDSPIYEGFPPQCQQNFDLCSAHNLIIILFLGAADYSLYQISGKEYSTELFISEQ